MLAAACRACLEADSARIRPVPRRRCRSEVTGFRAPYFQVNEALGQVLDDLGWLA